MSRLVSRSSGRVSCWFISRGLGWSGGCPCRCDTRYICCDVIVNFYSFLTLRSRYYDDDDDGDDDIDDDDDGDDDDNNYNDNNDDDDDDDKDSNDDDNDNDSNEEDDDDDEGYLA